jgi:hypothetical protein
VKLTTQCRSDIWISLTSYTWPPRVHLHGANLSQIFWIRSNENEDGSLWVVAPCSPVEVYRRFRRVCCVHHQRVEWEPQISQSAEEFGIAQSLDRTEWVPPQMQSSSNSATYFRKELLRVFATTCFTERDEQTERRGWQVGSPASYSVGSNLDSQTGGQVSRVSPPSPLKFPQANFGGEPYKLRPLPSTYYPIRHSLSTFPSTVQWTQNKSESELRHSRRRRESRKGNGKQSGRESVWAYIEKLKTFLFPFNFDTICSVLIHWLLHNTLFCEPKEP